MNNNKFILPGAIVVAALLVGAAIFFSDRGGNSIIDPNGTPEPTTKIELSDGDHILGNPDAEIKLVEYADPQCHFCRAFHTTMKNVISEYGEDGKVAWVYRHFIIFGEQSMQEATATECAAELGGDEKFWTYLDALFAAKGENARLLPGKTLDGIAAEIGLDTTQFNTCLSSRKYDEKINSWKDQAVAAGGSGTPYTLVIDKDGEILGPINGAQPFENVKAIIDQILAETQE